MKRLSSLTCAFLFVGMTSVSVAQVDTGEVATTFLGDFGGQVSGPEALNLRGQIVGLAETAAGDFHAFLWERGTLTDLGTVGGASSGAAAVNL
jgi:probable HAF family extracellular repeat protein